MLSVFKNVGGRSIPKDYCPVSLFSVVFKVFKEPVNNRFVDHLKKYGRFLHFQCGFRSSPSTADLLKVGCVRVFSPIGLGLLKEKEFIYLRLLTASGMLLFFTNVSLLEVLVNN